MTVQSEDTEICRPGSEVRFQSLMRNTFPCVTVERVVLWTEYSVSDMGYNERLESALQPMSALWLRYLLQALEIAMYPTVQVTVVRNSLLCGCSTCYSRWKQLCILQYKLQLLETAMYPCLLCGYSTCSSHQKIAMYPKYKLQLLETAMYPKPALWLQYLLKSLEIAMYPAQVTVVRNSSAPYACFMPTLRFSHIGQKQLIQHTRYSLPPNRHSNY